MYEIYINDRPLRLISAADLQQEQIPTSPAHLLARYTGKVKTLLHYADLLEKGSPNVAEVTLYHHDLNQLWTDFLSHYKIVAAAGGLVQLAGTDQYLFIFRRGFLDLPKGKVDPGETIDVAALREVEEETGVRELVLLDRNTISAAPFPFDPNLFDPPVGQLPVHFLTLHTYRNRKENRVLKPTFWFRMRTEQQELTPQIEEDISWAKWLTLADARNGNIPFYNSLRALLARL